VGTKNPVEIENAGFRSVRDINPASKFSRGNIVTSPLATLNLLYSAKSSCDVKSRYGNVP
jgi:hypothetical protein